MFWLLFHNTEHFVKETCMSRNNLFLAFESFKNVTLYQEKVSFLYCIVSANTSDCNILNESHEEYCPECCADVYLDSIPEYACNSIMVCLVEYCARINFGSFILSQYLERGNLVCKCEKWHFLTENWVRKTIRIDIKSASNFRKFLH